MPDFKSDTERREWIMANADYFTCIRRRHRRYERIEELTLAQARETASLMHAEAPERPVMIYAVWGIHDCWVENVGTK